MGEDLASGCGPCPAPITTGIKGDRGRGEEKESLYFTCPSIGRYTCCLLVASSSGLAVVRLTVAPLG